MFVAKVVFGKCSRTRRREEPPEPECQLVLPPPRLSHREELRDLALGYLISMRRHGQIHGEFPLDWCRGELTGYVTIPRPNAFESRFLSRWAKKELRTITEAFGRAPRWSLLSDNAPKRFPSWRSATFLYLSCGAFSEDPPVRRGDDGASIPAYLLPVSASDRDSVYSWANSYDEHNMIWLESKDLEIPAYKQMALPDSGLSQRGRELCRAIERATGIKTYYFLMRYHGREGDEDRPCPVCGRPWRVRGKTTFARGRIEFLCARCRLVSNDTIDRSSKRLARIGEYHGPPRAPGDRRRPRASRRRS